MIKKVIQKMLKGLGYRMVPRALDARSVLDQLYGADIKTVIDVGANVGQTCAYWLNKFPEAKIHAFEPMPEALRELKRLESHSDGRLVVWDIAASDRTGSADFYVHKNHASSSSLLPTTENCTQIMAFTSETDRLTVKTDKIDTVLAEQNIEGPVFIKLDVQGAELKALKGAAKMLTSTQFVLCEVNIASLYKQQASFVDLLTFMQGAGFSLGGFAEQFHLDDGQAMYFDAVFIKGCK